MSHSFASNRVEAALESPSPFEALFSLAQDLKSEGMSQDEMQVIFDHFRAVHQDDVDETKYDAILDTMDFIVGWCSSGKELFWPTE